MSGLALGQDKPRVFVQGKGSQNVTSSGSGGGGQHWGSWGARSSIDSHDEAMQVTRDLQKDCPGVTVTLNQSAADYTVMLNRESKHNRGLLRTNSQIQVANRLGDILGTNATRTVGSASKEACQLILADWSEHGRVSVQDSPPPAPATAPVAPPTATPSPEASTADSTPAPSAVKLQVDSTPPGADIEVDGDFVGNTPSDVQVTEGEHAVAVKKTGFKGWERKLKVSVGSRIRLNAELEKSAVQ